MIMTNCLDSLLDIVAWRDYIVLVPFLLEFIYEFGYLMNRDCSLEFALYWYKPCVMGPTPQNFSSNELW